MTFLVEILLVESFPVPKPTSRSCILKIDVVVILGIEGNGLLFLTLGHDLLAKVVVVVAHIKYK
jgi:hypothetical protein